MRLPIASSALRALAEPSAGARTQRRVRPVGRRARLATVAVVVAISLAIHASLSIAAGPIGGASAISSVAAAGRAVSPNIVLILTDDQRWDTLRYMPIVRGRLAGHGVTFERAYVVNPVCCPSRATIETGQYSHGTGVYSNHPNQPYGGFPAFTDVSTIATWLDGAGYRTALIGKYLNGYETTYVPPGWDRWFSTYGGGGYYDYQVTSDGLGLSFGDHVEDYGTNVLADEAVTFIRDTPDDDPLFLFFSPHAPHEPALAAPGDGAAFRSIRSWRPDNYDEPGVEDKPDWVRAQGRLTDGQRRAIDEFRKRQLASLVAVDRAAGRILDALVDEGRLRDTLLVFTSDNGMLWGEHRLFGKGAPYEEALRVPYVVRYDRLIDEPRVDRRHLVLNLDLAPTFAAAAGVEAPDAEGLDVTSLLRSGRTPWRSVFLIEHLSLSGHGAPTFCAAHTEAWVLIAYGTGERELYDLRRDPLQLDNLAGRPRHAHVERDLMRQLRNLCRPAPPGYDL